jgi:hypothetical protein
MKNVKKPKNVKNLIIKGSCPMYPTLYILTHKEMKYIINNIITVNESNNKPIFICMFSIINKVYKSQVITLLLITTS